MRVLITGGGRFLGQKLVHALAARGVILGESISAMELIDVLPPAKVDANFPASVETHDISDPALLVESFSHKPDVVWHLVAVVSGAAEAGLDIGMCVNLQGTPNVFEGARFAGNRPVLVYASSWAAHGGEEPVTIEDGIELNPQTSYGTQKVISELLLNDYTQRGRPRRT